MVGALALDLEQPRGLLKVCLHLWDTDADSETRRGSPLVTDTPHAHSTPDVEDSVIYLIMIVFVEQALAKPVGLLIKEFQKCVGLFWRNFSVINQADKRPTLTLCYNLA